MLRDVATGHEIRQFEINGDPIVFSPDGRFVLGSDAPSVVLWDVATGAEMYRADANALISSLAFSPDGKRAVTATLGDGACVWEVPSGKKIHCGFSPDTVSAVFSPDGRYLLTTVEMGGATLWNTTTGDMVRSYNIASYSTAFSADGRQILAGCADGITRLLDTATGAEVRRFEGKVEEGRRRSHTPRMAQCSFPRIKENIVRVWDLTSGSESAPVRPPVCFG